MMAFLKCEYLRFYKGKTARANILSNLLFLRLATSQMRVCALYDVKLKKLSRTGMAHGKF